MLSYRPGSKNVKPDTLSRQFPSSSEDRPPESIIPSSLILAPVSWSIETVVWEVQDREAVPDGCPPDRLFVPLGARCMVLQWAHSSRLTSHLGGQQTLELLRRRFWWPSVEADTLTFVSACPTCAQNKNTRQQPLGLLHVLPTPSQAWSHLSMDFITGLPFSEGHTVILVIVDLFSKAAHFLPLPKLPSACETAQHVFRLHGLPLDIVSDGGPQFSSRFWRAFCMTSGVISQSVLGLSPSVQSPN